MPQKESQYSVWIAFILIFNVIAGTGVLTLPGALRHSGWGLGLIVLVILALSSYMSMTFIVECIAIANAVKKLEKLQNPSAAKNDSDSDEDTTLLQSSFYSLKKRMELVELGHVFFGPVGHVLVFVCVVAFMYGNLTVFTTLMAKTMMDVVCTFRRENMTCKDVPENQDLCWAENTHSRIKVYRMFVLFYVMLLGPLGFFTVQKTKLLHIAATAVRWFAFLFMTVYAIQKLGHEGQQGHPPLFNYRGLPLMFGTSVYAYMCHYAIPSVIAPVRDKTKVKMVLAADCAVVMLFYVLVAETGTFAFHHVYDLYSLNFNPRGGGECQEVTGPVMIFFGYFLTVFPIFTVGSNYPIDLIVLRDNLMVMILEEGKEYSWILRRIGFPLFTIIPPTVLALISNDIQRMVGLLGAYAGAGIQFFVPAALIFTARKVAMTGLDPAVVNLYRSPFQHIAWPIAFTVFSVVCVILVTIHNIHTFFF